MFWVNELSVYPSPSAPPLLRLLVFTSSSRLRRWYTDCEARAAQASPTLLLCTPRCLWGCNYQSSHAIEVGHAYDPFCFRCCFWWVFSVFFSALLAMTHCEVFTGRGVNSPGLYWDTCLTSAADCVGLYPFNFVAAQFLEACLWAVMSLFSCCFSSVLLCRDLKSQPQRWECKTVSLCSHLPHTGTVAALDPVISLIMLHSLVNKRIRNNKTLIHHRKNIFTLCQWTALFLQLPLNWIICHLWHLLSVFI